MTEFVRRPIVSLLMFTVLHITLLSVQITNENGRTLLRSWSLAIFTPVAWAIHSATDTVKQAWSRYVFLYRAEEERARLLEENSRLRLEIANLHNLRQLLDRIPEYEKVRAEYTFSTIPAAVIWKSPPFYSQRLLINAGTRDGVKVNSAVIDPRGIVGRVIATTPFTAEVELITNAGAGAGALLADSRLEGVIRGDGSPVLSWWYIPSYEKADVGDTIFTSGTDQIYPKGIRIGRIISSVKGNKIHREIRVEPSVDFRRLEEVLIVMRK
ncbi:MAG TPA: rod shape-determining protein MreC [Acidobacteriota bacterium]|nr:rod shape-determining protein MreC [Acidobacteriota bacterium]